MLDMQLFSILLAATLKAFGPEQPPNHDSDEEYTLDKLPLLTPFAGAMDVPTWTPRETTAN